MAEEETPEPTAPAPEVPAEPEAPATEEKVVKVEVDTSQLQAELAKTNAKLDAVLDKIAKSEAEPAAPAEPVEPEVPAEPEAPAEEAPTEAPTEGVVATPEPEVATSDYDGLVTESGGVKGQAMYLEQESWPITLQPSAQAVARAVEVSN